MAIKNSFYEKGNREYMISIEKADNIEQEYLQCSSCLKCNDDLQMLVS